MNRHPFIVLEGLSGTGKTTVGKLLSDRLGGILLHTPLSPFARIREEVDLIADLRTRYLFYLASVVQASAVAKYLLAVHPVICDRYVLTTQCYHEAAGLRWLIRVEEMELLSPDLTVLLTCCEEERLKRLQRRGLTHNDIVEQRNGLDRAFLNVYRRHKLPEIDTTFITPDQVAELILQLLREVSVTSGP